MLDTFIEKVKNAKTPGSLTDVHMELAVRYAELSDRYELYIPDIVKKKKDLMSEFEAVSKAEAAFDISECGIFERKVKIELKAIEKLMSAIKRRLETLTGEARNQY